MPDTADQISETLQIEPPILETPIEPPILETEKKMVRPRGPYKKRSQDGPKIKEDASQNQEAGPDQEAPPKLEVEELWSPKKEKAAREAGKKATMMLINFPGLYNPELIPSTDHEKAAALAFMEAGGEYFVSQKLGDLPPGMAFAMAGLAYYAVLLTAERNRGIIKGTWAKLKGAWAWYKAKRSVK
jgi:hypothetical protein